MNQAVKPSPLGRGLSALFGDADTSYTAKPAAPSSAPASKTTAKSTPLNPDPRTLTPSSLETAWLHPGAFQPRRHFDETALNELASSIKACGILEPLVVRPVPDHENSFEIIAGERRWRAAQLAGLHEVPVIIRNLTDREALEFGIIENVQREDLSALEEAEGYKRLMDEFQHTQANLSKIIGKSAGHIGNTLRILTLPQAVKQMIEEGKITLGHARALITAKDPVALAQMIVKKGLSVRDTERLIKREHEAAKNPEKAKQHQDIDTAIATLEKDLERVVGLKIKIASKGNGGAFTLFYSDLDQLDLIIKRVKG